MMKVFSKIAVTIGSVALVGSAFQSQALAEDHGFNDTDGHWAEEEILYLTDEGYLTGYTGGDFKPDGSINRAEASAVLFRQQGLSEVDADFDDVDADFWAQGKIGALQSEEILSGYGDGTFRPDNEITRAEVAILISNTFDFENDGDSGNDYSDVSESDQAYEGINELKNNHIMRGYGDGTFRPDESITRAEFSVVMARTLNEDFREELIVQAKTDYLLDALMNEDFETIADHAHPEEGVRFSPYVYVQADDQVFHSDDLDNWLADDTVYHWGAEDGTGDPIEKTTTEYYERFLVNHNYQSWDERVYNEDMNRGNTENNIQTFFPDASFTEYYVDGDEEEYAGMDWGSNTLVMQKYDGDWYLIAIVNDEWTI